MTVPHNLLSPYSYMFLTFRRLKKSYQEQCQENTQFCKIKCVNRRKARCLKLYLHLFTVMAAASVGFLHKFYEIPFAK